MTVRQWAVQTAVSEQYPCSCGKQAEGVACHKESLLTDYVEMRGRAQRDGSITWEASDVDAEEEELHHEHFCDCLPEPMSTEDWSREVGEPEIVKSVVRERCEACGEELGA